MKKDMRRCVQCYLLNHRLLMLSLSWSSEDEKLMVEKENSGRRSHYICSHFNCLERLGKPKRLRGLFPAFRDSSLTFYRQEITQYKV